MSQTPLNPNPCTGTISFTAAGLEQELRDLKKSMKDMDTRMYNEILELKEEIAKINVVVEHNRNQDKAYKELRQEVSGLTTEVKSNRSFVDRALGAGALVVVFIAALEVYLIARPSEKTVPPLITPPPDVAFVDPNGN